MHLMKDLLTFRADRDRYYYPVDDLFNRHPDLIKMLCDQSPDLVPKLLDDLIWRSRLTDNGMRRVNYYVKHLLIDEDGAFNKTLSWISSTMHVVVASTVAHKAAKGLASESPILFGE